MVAPCAEHDGVDTPWIEQISWSPRASVYHNFLSKEECEYLIELARWGGQCKVQARPRLESTTRVSKFDCEKADGAFNLNPSFF